MTVYPARILRHMGATGRLIVVNAAVWLAVWLMELWLTPEPWLSLPSHPAVWLTRPWTLLTYMVVQYSFWHLLMNVLWLWMFGRALELTMPPKTIWQLYLAGGVSGGMAYMGMGLLTGSGGLLCGASAAVLSIMVAAMMRSPDLELHLFILGPVRLKWVALAGIILLMIGAGGGTGIGSACAHAGGMVAGLVYMLRFRRPQAGKHAPITRKGTRRVRQAMRRHQRDTARLDALLEKISASSYDSLTNAEKRELHRLSARLRVQSSINKTPGAK